MLAYSYKVTNPFTGESIDINAGLDNDGACTTVDGKPTGVRLTSYPGFELDVRSADEEKVGQHGIFSFPSFYNERDITFQGKIFAESHVQIVQIEERIKRIFALPSQPIEGVNDGFVLIEWTDALGNDWQINAKISSDVRFRRAVGVKTEADFFINLIASDPKIISQEEFQQDSLLGWRQSMFTVPAFLPNDFNFRLANVINIYRDGTGDAPWRARLYGPATNPKMTRFNESYDNETVLSDFVSGWVGGQEENVLFQTNGVARRLVSTAGVQETMSLTQAFDLTSARYISFYLYIDDITKIDTTDNYIRFIENSGTDYFDIAFDFANPTLRDGWNYFYLLRQQFEITGNPSWNDITEIEFSIKATAGNDLNIIFDDLRLRDITFTENKLETLVTLGSTDYLDIDIDEGTVLKNGVQDVSGFVTVDSDFFSLLPRQNILLYESLESPPISWVLPTQLIEFKWNSVIL